MAYPVAAYDTKTNIFGDIISQRNLTLGAEVTTVGQTTITFTDNITDLVSPTYIKFPSTGEIIKATTTSGSTTFTGVTRGFGGTPTGTYTIGAEAYVVLAGDHFNKLRDALLNLQRFRAVRVTNIGDFTGTLLTNSYPGKVAVSNDGKTSVKIGTSAVKFSGMGDHGSYDEVWDAGIEYDDHLQLLNSSRIVGAHNSISGQHVTNGNSHDHSVGTGVGRIRSGLNASKPTAATAGLGGVYYATDTKELYVSNGSAWVIITGAPTGAIIMFISGSSCPAGWTRFTGLDGRFPRGAPTGSNPGANGGSATHSHTYSALPSHTHGIAQFSVSTNSTGSHSPSFPASKTNVGSGLGKSPGYGSGSSYEGTGGGGNHGHSFTIPATTTSSTGSAGPLATTTEQSLPPYYDVLFCIKS